LALFDHMRDGRFTPESGQARATNQQIVNVRAQWRRKRIY
jgi:hypothetical protein